MSHLAQHPRTRIVLRIVTIIVIVIGVACSYTGTTLEGDLGESTADLGILIIMIGMLGLSRSG